MNATEQQIRRLVAAFPGKDISPETVTIYADRLSDIPAEHLPIVIERIIDTRTFFPAVAEIKEAYVDLLLGPPDPHGALEWCKAERKRLEFEAEQRYWAQDVLSRGLQRPTPAMPSEWRDPVTQETVRLCGWDDLFAMDEDFQFGYWAKRYAEARELVSKRFRAGDLRLSIPEPSLLRQMKAVS